jgi:hypothetical protein
MTKYMPKARKKPTRPQRSFRQEADDLRDRRGSDRERGDLERGRAGGAEGDLAPLDAQGAGDGHEHETQDQPHAQLLHRVGHGECVGVEPGRLRDGQPDAKDDEGDRQDPLGDDAGVRASCWSPLRALPNAW